MFWIFAASVCFVNQGGAHIVPSTCHVWYYTTLKIVNSGGNGNFSGSRSVVWFSSEIKKCVWYFCRECVFVYQGGAHIVPSTCHVWYYNHTKR